MRWLMVLSGIALSVGTAGCGNDGESASTVQVFTEEDSTAEARFAAGEHFEVRLVSTPGTGYAWEIAAPAEPPLVEVVDRRFEEPESDLVGAAGFDVWEFAAGSEGAGVLRLEYVRSFDDPPVAERVFELIVRIEGAEWPPPDGTTPTVHTATAPDGQ